MWINATAENIEQYLHFSGNVNYKLGETIWVFLTYYGNVFANDNFAQILLYKDGELFVQGEYDQDEPIIKFMLAEEWVKICHPEKQFKI